jgi:hypothetical protein
MTVKEAMPQPATRRLEYVEVSEEEYWAHIRQSVARADAQFAAGLCYTQEEVEEMFPECLDDE